jgi:hypothetical protein
LYRLGIPKVKRKQRGGDDEGRLDHGDSVERPGILECKALVLLGLYRFGRETIVCARRWPDDAESCERRGRRAPPRGARVEARG